MLACAFRLEGAEAGSGEAARQLAFLWLTRRELTRPPPFRPKRANGVAVETQLHARGGHGFGMRHTAGLPVADWPEHLLDFGRSTGWLA